MSKSFSMRLSDYTIARPIGAQEVLLNRTVDMTDVVTLLSDEGFTNFNEERTVHPVHGRDLSNLRERIASQVLGVPREAYIEIDAYGPQSDFLVIKFHF